MAIQDVLFDLVRQFTDLARRVERLETWEGSGGGSPTGSSKQYRTFNIAASNTTADGKATADYICDGTDDQVEINAALAVATTSGYRGIRLLEGTFNITGTITGVSNLIFDGQGDATVLQLKTNPTYVFRFTGKSNVTLRDFKIEGKDGDTNIFHTHTIRLDGSCRSIRIDNITFSHIDATAGIELRNTFREIDIVNCRMIDYDINNTFIETWPDVSQQAKHLKITDNTFVGTTDTFPDAIGIEGYTSSTVPAPDSRSVQYITISNNMFYGYGIGPGSDNGIFATIKYCSHITAQDNVLHFCTSGFTFVDCYDYSVGGNTITAIGSTGISSSSQFYSENGGGGRNFSIVNNTLRNSSGDGIAVTGPVTSTSPYPTGPREDEDLRVYGKVVGNALYYCDTGISGQQTSNLDISDNSIFNDGVSGTVAINLDESFECSIAGNNVGQYAGDGIQISGSIADDKTWDIIVRDNIIVDNGDDGLMIETGQNIIVRNNTFINNGGDHIFVTNIGTITVDRVLIDGNYFQDAGAYTVNLNHTGITGIVIRDNIFKGSAGTSHFRVTSTQLPVMYRNTFDDGVENIFGTERNKSLTISSDTISVVQTSDFIVLNPESGVTDDLSTITANSWDGGRMIVLAAESSGDTITVKHNVANIVLDGSADKSLDNPVDTLVLRYDATQSKWCQVSFSNNS